MYEFSGRSRQNVDRILSQKNQAKNEIFVYFHSNLEILTGLQKPCDSVWIRHQNCLQGFPTEISRDKHFKYCKENETVRIKMPKEGSLVKFQDGQNQFKVPFTMYADFEAILEPIEATPGQGPSPNPNPKESRTAVINQHIPSGFCVNSKFAYGKVENPLKLYRGEHRVEVFFDYISNEARRLHHMFPKKVMKPLTCEQWRKFNRTTNCHIYLNGFKLSNRKVRDHCHCAGKYRGLAHNICNLRHKIPHYIPIVFHNLSRYDAHLFIRELDKKLNTGKIGVIVENKEK